MKRISRAAVAVAMIIGMPTAACTYRTGSAVNGSERAAAEDSVRGEVFSTALPQNYDRSLQQQVQVAQSEPTIRQQESVRSGGSSTGGGNAPPPGSTALGSTAPGSTAPGSTAK